MFGRKAKERPRMSVVIAAAGSASRMGGMDKQLLLLGDIPVFMHSVLTFSSLPETEEIVLVCRGDQMGDFYAAVRESGCEKVSHIVAGSGTRQKSVFEGVRACTQSDYLAIHDGARPLITREAILACLDRASLAGEEGAAAAGVPVKDTLKVAGDDGLITETPDRSRLWAAQTPQIFAWGLYLRAMEHAEGDGLDYTDDCQLVEAVGGKVYLVRGDYRNIKITTPEDLTAAELYYHQIQDME